MSEETKTEKLVQILKSLKHSGDIDGAAIITKDGLLIVSEISEGVDTETVAAMTAALVGAAETAVSELKKGLLERIIIDSQKGKIITVSAGEKAILVVLTVTKVNLGLALLEMEKASQKIMNVLGD
jgi:hypothetical protein